MNHEKLLSLGITEKDLSYRDTIPCIGLKTIVGAIAGTIYSMHPFSAPEGVNEICAAILAKLRQNQLMVTPEFTYKLIGSDFECLEMVNIHTLNEFLNRELKKIPEFQNLNLSLNEKRAGITSAEDPRRESSIAFVSRYSGTPIADDFIDLDACVRNIFHEILLKAMDDQIIPIRNMRYFPERCVSAPKDSNDDAKEAITKEETVSTSPSKNHYIAIDIIIGVICWEFHSQYQTWKEVLDEDAFNKAVSTIAKKSREYLMSRAIKYNLENLSKVTAPLTPKPTICEVLHPSPIIGYDDEEELKSILNQLGESGAFQSLMSLVDVPYLDLFKENFLGLLWQDIQVMKNPGVSFRLIQEEDEKSVEESPDCKRKHCVEIRVIDNAIAEYFYEFRNRLWSKYSDADFNIAILTICGHFDSFLINGQHQWEIFRPSISLADPTYVKYDDANDLFLMISRLVDIDAFGVLCQNASNIDSSAPRKYAALAHVNGVYQKLIYRIDRNKEEN